jgi:hypothetical protein
MYSARPCQSLKHPQSVPRHLHQMIAGAQRLLIHRLSWRLQPFRSKQPRLPLHPPPLQLRLGLPLRLKSPTRQARNARRFPQTCRHCHPLRYPTSRYPLSSILQEVHPRGLVYPDLWPCMVSRRKCLYSTPHSAPPSSTRPASSSTTPQTLRNPQPHWTLSSVQRTYCRRRNLTSTTTCCLRCSTYSEVMSDRRKRMWVSEGTACAGAGSGGSLRGLADWSLTTPLLTNHSDLFTIFRRHFLFSMFVSSSWTLVSLPNSHVASSSWTPM